MSKLPKQCKICNLNGLFWSVLVMLIFAHPASAMYVYLPVVGAPDLRFETVTTNSFNYLVFSQKQSALEAKTAMALSNATAPAANTNDTDSSAALSSVAA